MKKIYPKSNSLIIQLIIQIMIIIALIYTSITSTILGLKEDLNMFLVLPISMSLILYLIYILITDTFWHIVITKNYISASKCKQQKPVTIYFDEIIEFDLIKSKLDSNDHYYSYGSGEDGKNWIVESLFIRFSCKNNNEKKLWVKRYTTKQIDELLSLIKTKITKT